MTIQTNPRFGAAVNQLRKLERNWNYWFPLRQADPLRGRNAEQMLAEDMCSRMAPKICALRREIEEMSR